MVEAAQMTEKLQNVNPTNEPKCETVEVKPPVGQLPPQPYALQSSSRSSRTGLIIGAVLGVLALMGTAIGGLIYLQISKTDEVALANSNNSAINKTLVSSNINSSNVNTSEVFVNGISNSESPSNANGKLGLTPSPTQAANTNKSTPKPTKEPEVTPTPKSTATPPPAPTPIETPEPDPTRRTPKVVSGGVMNGKATNLVKPPYPPAARAVRASGVVQVQVLIDENGNVISASAMSGHALLRASAESAARASKFSPTMLSGQRVKVMGVIVYNFTAQ